MVNAGMQPREALREVEARLTAAGCPDADFDAGELFRLVTGQDARLADRPLTAEQAAKLEALTVRRATREPLQYLCGSWPFLDFELAVGPGVLCPRADTEVVAEAAAQMLAGVQAPKVLDLCAGTGCLGLGVKRFCPEADVTCVEKSPEAFRYLKKNAVSALKQGTARAVEGDLFHYRPAGGGAGPHRFQPALPDRRRDESPAARGGPGTGHGIGSRGGRAGILPRPCGTLPERPAARRSAGAGDRLAAAGSGNCPAGGKRLGGHRMPQRLRRQRPVHSGPEIVPIKLQK